MAVVRNKLATTNGSQVDAARIRLGSAGELAIASELMLRGWGVYNQMTPDNSDAFDIIATKGGKILRIQVKTTGKIQLNGSVPRYVISCCKRSGGLITPLTKKDCDFVIAYIYDRGWVLVIPVSCLKVKSFAISFRKDGQPSGKHLKYLDAWELLDKKTPTSRSR